MSLEATLTGSGSAWTAELALLDTRAPASAAGDSPETALEALVVAALDQVRDEARAQGLPLTPAGLVAAEMAVRGACSLALYRHQTPTPTLAVGDPLGTDVSTFVGTDGLDRQFRVISGARAVAEAVARRWLTPRDSLVYAPGYGEDVRELLNGAVTQPILAAFQSSLEAQALADERVEACSVQIAESGPPAARSLKITASLVTASGPFRLVLTVDQLVAQLELLTS